MRKREATRERGSLSPLVIGALMIGVLLLGVITDSSRVFLAHRQLVRLADSTSLAAASAMDIGTYYSGGSVAAIPLDQGQAWQIAQAWIGQNSPTKALLEVVQIDSLHVENGQVSLVLSARISGLGGSHFMTITASSAARSQRR